MFASSAVRVEGGDETVGTAVNADGTFSIQVPLKLNHRNLLFVIEQFDGGLLSPPVTLDISQDSTQPSLSIQFPQAGAHVGSSNIIVVGRVLDMLSGGSPAQVFVNGQSAELMPGPGGTWTFRADDVSLASGGIPTELVVLAMDAAGNEANLTTSVTFDLPVGDRLVEVTGNGQVGLVRGELAQPIVVRVLDGDGQAVAGKALRWDVTSSDGTLSSESGAEGSPVYYSLTDSSGYGFAWWRLGGDSGTGNNRVEVSSVDLSGTPGFQASGMAEAAVQVNVSSGEQQSAGANSPALAPLRAWASDGCNGVAGVPVTFRIATGNGQLIVGQNFAGKSVEVLTDEQGYAEVGLLLGTRTGANVVEASIGAETASIAQFQIEGLLSTPSTEFVGMIFDGSDRALVGATCTLSRAGSDVAITLSNEHGEFRFEDISEQGTYGLLVDGSTATATASTPIDPLTYRFPALHYEPYLVANARNHLPRPIQLPQLNLINDVPWSGEEDVQLNMFGVDGMTMTIRAGSMILPDGTQPSSNQPVTLSLNQVHSDDIPMRPSNGAAPRLTWTLQPAGAHFDPPVEVSYPNVNGLAPGSTTFLLSFDHDTGRFEVVGTARVSEDGSVARSDEGQGLTVSGWGGQCPPYANTGTVTKNLLLNAKQVLTDHWHETEDTPLGPLNEQIACLASAACGITDFHNPEENPQRPAWAEGWIPAVLDCLAKDVQNPSNANNVTSYAVEALCNGLELNPALLVMEAIGLMNRDDVCSLLGGGQHFIVGLAPCFWEHCEAIAQDEKEAEEQGRESDHEAFFRDGVVACFGQVEGFSPDIAEVSALLVPYGASAFRETIIQLCPLKSYFGGLLAARKGFGVGSTLGAPPTYPELGAPGSVSEWASAGLASKATLQLNASTFDINVGAPIQLSLLRELPDGTFVDLANAPDTEWLVVDAGMITNIDSAGVLTCDQTPSALAAYPMALYVFGVNGEDVGIGQFGVRGVDSDGDLIADHFELEFGMDPLTYNAPDSDLDGDGLSDFEECMRFTNPTLPDTDGDGVDDGTEVLLGSSPIDPTITQGQIGAEWNIWVGGQTTQSATDGSFTVANLASDGSLLKVDAQRVIGDITLYARSEYFSLDSGEVLLVDELHPSLTPPPTVISLSTQPSAGILTTIGLSGQMQTIAELSDENFGNVTLRSSGTSYGSSNTAVVQVGDDGELSAFASGQAFITAMNDGVVSVAKVRVELDAGFTSVVGFTRGADNQPVPATVIVLEQGIQVTADADGRFELSDVIADPMGIVLRANYLDDGALLTAITSPLPAIEDDITDAGILLLNSSDTAGKDFAICFPTNSNGAAHLRLFIAADSATTGSLSIPGLGFMDSFVVQPGEVTILEVPLAAELTEVDGVADRAVLIQTESDVCVYGLTIRSHSTDAFSAYPTDTFRTEHMALGRAADPGGSLVGATQLAVVAIEDNTLVTIRPFTALLGHAAGVDFQVTLNANECYQLSSLFGDVTGTTIVSSHPVGVFAGNRCAEVPLGFNACDTVVQMIPPLGTWGNSISVVSLESREGGDSVTVVASEDGTQIDVIGDTPMSTVLNRGESWTVILDGMNQVQGSAPILVAQFANGTEYDGQTGDPFEMILPPASQFQSRYVFTTPAAVFQQNYINIVAPSDLAMDGAVQLDGASIPPVLFRAFGSSGFAGVRLPIPPGIHRVESIEPIGLTVYGFSPSNSYGYPGGMALEVPQ